MAENPVSDPQALLESMLQKLWLNTQTNISSCSSPVEYNAETVEDSSKATAFQIGFSPSNKEQNRHSSIRNKLGNPWTQQSAHFGGMQAPFGNQPPKRIKGVSSKPKRSPLIWGEHNHFTSERSNDAISGVGEQEMPRHKKWKQFSLEGETKGVSSVPPLYKTEPYQNSLDLLAPTSATSTLVLDKPEVKGQRGICKWDVGKGKSEGTSIYEESGKTTKTSKKWGEAKRWAQKVKERWRERHRNTETRQRDDEKRQVQNVVQSNLSPILVPTDVNNTTTAVTEDPNIHDEPNNTELDESALCSLSHIRENLFSFGTSNLIFNGTEWAQFNSSTQEDQSQESPSSIDQSCKEEWNGKWNHSRVTQPEMLLPESFTQDVAFNKHVYNEMEMSKISFLPSDVQDLTANQSQMYDLFTNQLQTTNQSFNKSQNSEQTSEQSQFSHQPSYESMANEHSVPHLISIQQSRSQPQVYNPSYNQPQSGKEDSIPILDLSHVKPMNSSSIKSRISLGRKREHWTKRRNPFEDTRQDMEDEDHGNSFMAAYSSNSTHSNSPTTSLQNSEDSDFSKTMETVVKKRRMEDSRCVRFAEEVVIFPPSFISKDDDDCLEDDCPEEPSPHSSFPKWIRSLKPKPTRKHKF
ncbi:uncharacterized protein LOC127417929 [Myxocyprinus asiaticus]|uniref:uncharacterized protein LOC127417929 n=1 Tax=Myxocyprinus asiaticus TaxID=70543 RepID=UPI00222395C2|nr:uncharacterized protein LOC127417929 [Myxocyprinus asiaticus]XP_051514161.1 uncharacterized protein LOC127417929 [Myxocyprinus asiaticus]